MKWKKFEDEYLCNIVLPAIHNHYNDVELLVNSEQKDGEIFDVIVFIHDICDQYDSVNDDIFL